jgi:hypothetical protein
MATASDLAAAAGVGRRTVEILESATHTGYPRITTLSKIESALGWEPGSCERVREGREPVYLSDPAMARLRAAWPRLTRDQRESVAHLAQDYIRRR